MKNFFKIFIATFFLTLSFSPFLANAGEVFLSTKNIEFARGEDFIVEVKLNTQGQQINAVEGELVFSSGLGVKSISDGKSVINFWIQKPQITKLGNVRFSGLTPGGFNGDNNLLFKVTFSGKVPGQNNIYLNNLRVLLNDGLGTQANITTIPITVLINQKINNEILNLFSFDKVVTDNEPPEGFKPMLASDPLIYNGYEFITFTTQDKISGIDHYEVREGDLGIYVVAQSPYPLKNQKLDVPIYVKAVDREGNQRVEVLEPKNPIPVSKPGMGIFAVLGLFLLAIVLYIKKQLQTK